MTILKRPGCDLHTIVQLKLRKNIGKMTFDGVFRDEQLMGYLRVGSTEGDKTEHVLLAFGQYGVRPVPRLVD
jgi:hypothetical protein